MNCMIDSVINPNLSDNMSTARYIYIQSIVFLAIAYSKKLQKWQDTKRNKDIQDETVWNAEAVLDF